jgi:hypothetical protein
MKFPEQFRIQQGKYTSETGDPFGLFHVPARLANGRTLRIIADDGSLTDWEHVSVSIPDRPDTCPSWPEMCLVKDLFWDAEDCVVQFHPPASQYINNHAGCLHLWRSRLEEIPTPPSILIGHNTLNLA